MVLQEPITHVSALDVFRRSTNVGDFLFPSHVVINPFIFGMVGQLAVVFAEILADVVSCLAFDVPVGTVQGTLVFLVVHVVLVVIPVEMAFRLALELVVKLALHRLHHVESDEEVGLVFELDLCAFHDLAVQGSLVGESLARQPFVELDIDVSQVIPKTHESFLQLGLGTFLEVGKELGEYLALFFVQIAVVV